jgi:hypothetical protein
MAKKTMASAPKRVARDTELLTALRSIDIHLRTIAAQLSGIVGRQQRTRHHIAVGGRVPDVHAAARYEVRRGDTIPELHASRRDK